MQEKSSVIYKITNTVNGKIYVGRTVSKLSRRWGRHVRAARKLGNTLIGRAIIKHGADAFSLKIIETVDSAEVHARETYWIRKLQATNPAVGYNLTDSSCGSSGVVGMPTREKLGQVSRDYWAGIPAEERSEMLRKRVSNVPKSSAHRDALAVSKAGRSTAGITTSKYVGVRFRPRDSSWETNCYHEGRCYGRTFRTEEEAAVGYDMFSIALRGTGAPVHFEERRLEYTVAKCRKFLLGKNRRSSKFKHVSYQAKSAKWCVFILGKYHGSFVSEEEAADLATSILKLQRRDELLRPDRRSRARPPLSGA